MKLLLISLFLFTQSLYAQIPQSTNQVIIGIAPDWNSSHVTLSVFERTDSTSPWKINGKGWKGRLGRNGLAWGLGLHQPNIIQHSTHKLIKKEGDGRAPAGIFRIGSAYGYANQINKHDKLPYRKITQNDLWVEDSKSVHYNRHLILKHKPSTTWEKKAQMRQGDYAHSLKLFISHNSPEQGKAKPFAGSAIFFHIWRGGGSKPTAGCTTMAPQLLKQLISTIKPEKKPLYVLLTKDEYKKLRAHWNLP